MSQNSTGRTNEPRGELGEKREPQATIAPVVTTPSAVPVIDAATLFGGSNELRLLYRGQEYRLRVTRQGKLLLTK